jgi:E-phenylitaconyl-CoA hydratase
MSARELATDEVQYDVRDGVGVITLNRPEQGNALSWTIAAALEEIWADVRDSSDVRVAIITGTGDRHFCTGADMQRAAADGHMRRDEGPMSEAVRLSPRQNRVWKPVIAAVNGVVNAGGLHFVVDSDIVIASNTATFMDTHVSVGQVSGIESIGLAKRLPLGAALRMTLSGRSYRMTARRAYELGLVDELTEPAELMSMALSIADEIKANSARAVSLTQQAVWSSVEVGYTAAMEAGWGLVRMHRYHPDSEEGPKAFAERRPPRWEGAAEIDP